MLMLRTEELPKTIGFTCVYVLLAVCPDCLSGCRVPFLLAEEFPAVI